MSNIRKITPQQAAACVGTSYRTKRPLMIWGAPGTAKSAVVRQAAEDMEIGFIDLRLCQIDAVDLRGMPYKDEVVIDGSRHVVMGFAASNILPRSGKGILFLDEIPQAPTLVQNAASELLLDRKIGEYHLPEGWGVVGAGNRRSDRAGTLEVPSHLKNRLVHVEMKSSLEDWLKWAAKSGINHHLMAYLKSNPAALYEFNPDALAYPTLRTWHFVSDILADSIRGEEREAMIAGCVGEGRAAELCVFLERSAEMPTYEDVIADPLHVPIPSKHSVAFSMQGMVATQGKIQDIPALIEFFKRCSVEEAMLSLTIMMERERGFKENKQFAEFFETLKSKKQA